MTEIVAEIGINHLGSLELAKEMCKKAKDCGADAVKFQTYRIKDLDPEWEYYDLCKTTCLSRSDFREIKKFCDEIGIEFFSMAETKADVTFLKNLGVERIKIASMFTKKHDPVIFNALDTGLPIIISTGGMDLKEISDLVREIDEDYPEYREDSKITLMYCVPEYPTPDKHVELQKMQIMEYCGLNLPVGFSDHSEGITAALMATAFGAKIVEKHITYDKNMITGPDHVASITFEELKELVDHKNRMEIMFGKVSNKEVEINDNVDIGDEFIEDTDYGI